MFTYVQATGQLFNNSVLMGVGYSGRDEGLNNPAQQCVSNVGPLPCGEYVIEDPHDNDRLGPLTFALLPKNLAQMCGRGGFYLHPDNRKRNRSASHGCVIMDQPIRLAIAAALLRGKAYLDRKFVVVAYLTSQ